MANKLTNLKIREVSAVDKGAGKGVKVVLRKADGTPTFGGHMLLAVDALHKSVVSILKNEPTKQHNDLLAATFNQFQDHLAEVTQAAGGAVDKKRGESDMDIAVLKKTLGLADSATEADVTKALADQAKAAKDASDNLAKVTGELEIAKANMTPDELKFHNELKDDEAKKAFRAKDHQNRTVQMEKREELPDSIKKIIADAESTKKQLGELLEKQNLADFAKQAKELGLPDTEAITLKKAYDGDKPAVDKLMSLVKAAKAQIDTGELFKEWGGPGERTNGEVMEELKAKAAEYRKAHPELSEAQAFAKVYSDPANKALAEKERNQNRPRAV
jgi:hypothetical protein